MAINTIMSKALHLSHLLKSTASLVQKTTYKRFMISTVPLDNLTMANKPDSRTPMVVSSSKVLQKARQAVARKPSTHVHIFTKKPLKSTSKMGSYLKGTHIRALKSSKISMSKTKAKLAMVRNWSHLMLSITTTLCL